MTAVPLVGTWYGAAHIDPDRAKPVRIRRFALGGAVQNDATERRARLASQRAPIRASLIGPRPIEAHRSTVAGLKNSGCSGDHIWSHRRACHNAGREVRAGRSKHGRSAGSGTPGTCTGASGPGERRCQREREVRGVLRHWALLAHPTVAHARCGPGQQACAHPAFRCADRPRLLRGRVTSSVDRPRDHCGGRRCACASLALE